MATQRLLGLAMEYPSPPLDTPERVGLKISCFGVLRALNQSNWSLKCQIVLDETLLGAEWGVLKPQKSRLLLVSFGHTHLTGGPSVSLFFGTSKSSRFNGSHEQLPTFQGLIIFWETFRRQKTEGVVGDHPPQ